MKKILLFAVLTLFFMSCGPVAYFTRTNSSTTAPAEIKFNNNSKRANLYEWDFGDGTKSEEANPSHIYTSSGPYTVVLRAKSKEKSSMMIENIKIKAPDKCLVMIETKFGNMLVELFDNTPLHRDNFLKLAGEEFYDGILFHRVINGFMIQGGDPQSKDAGPKAHLGSGGPGYQIPNEITTDNVHVRGALCAARQGDAVNPEKKSSGSQFYIVSGSSVNEDMLDNIERKKGFHYTPDQKKEYLENGGTPFLDMDYTVFGRVIDGLEVIDSISQVNTLPGDRPIESISMKMKVVD